MPRRLLTHLVVASLWLASTAQAGGLLLRWNACSADGGVSHRTFACNTNVGVSVLYASFVSDEEITGVTDVEVELELRAASGALPDWWTLYNSGACRERQLYCSAGSGADLHDCVHPYGSDVSGGMTGYFSVFDGGPTRLRSTWSEPAPDTMSFAPGQEYFVQRVAIGHGQTIGSSSCDGCALPVCVGIRSVTLVRSGERAPVRVYTEVFPGSSTTGWQGASPGSTLETEPGAAAPSRTLQCAAAVPTRQHTWGSIKSLYH